MRKGGTVPRNKSSGFSTLCLLGFVVILFWLTALLYSYHSGMLHNQADYPTMQVIEHFINETESKLISRYESLKHLHHHTPEEDADIHVIFSTDCSEYQDWQTLLLFHSAMMVKQPGPVTRIASGCSDEKKATLTTLYKTLYPHYHIHYTPDFKNDGKTNKKYDFYNKPYGVQHWLNHAEPPVRDGVVVALVDPDMIFLRPLVTQVKGMDNNLFPKSVLREEVMDRISKGHPVGQLYGLGAPWTNDHHKHFDRSKICDPGSPCLRTTQQFGEAHFSVGPPYMMEKTDLVRVVDSWTKLVPRVFAQYPYLLAEMYAYSMAAAHEDLPHLQPVHHMVSNVDSGDGEGWAHVAALDDVCAPPVDGIYFPGKPLPSLMHFCQTYTVGDLGFSKRRVSKTIFSCDHDMLMDPLDELKDIDYNLKTDRVSGSLTYLQGL